MCRTPGFGDSPHRDGSSHRACSVCASPGRAMARRAAAARGRPLAAISSIHLSVVLWANICPGAAARPAPAGMELDGPAWERAGATSPWVPCGPKGCPGHHLR